MDTKYIRQVGIFNPGEQRLKISIIGVGSSGSFIAFTLAKMGFKDILIIDYDVVEPHNIPNQLYRIKDIDKPKVVALKEIIHEFTDIDVKDVFMKMSLDEQIDLSCDRIYINCVDNIEGRKAIWSQLKDSPLIMLDGGVGGEEYSTMIIQCNNHKHQEQYEKYLNSEHKNLPCGFQNILYTIISECSEICNIIKRLNNKEVVPHILLRDMRSYKIIKGD